MIEEFDVNGVGVANGRFFGMPFNEKECPVVVIPVPWDATVSYNEGTAKGPKAIMNASLQVDLYDEQVPGAEEFRIGTDTSLTDFKKKSGEFDVALSNRQARGKAKSVIAALASGKCLTGSLVRLQGEVNTMSEKLNWAIENVCASYYDSGQIPAVVGGEHSVALGAIKAAAASVSEGLGVLQFDAHADLREAYEGFTYSHASVMYNVLKEISKVERLCQVGIRDFCADEAALMKKDKRIKTFTDRAIFEQLFNGKKWAEICDKIIVELPENVYISFDIDGLCPSLCPLTGTPVPGGLTFNMALFLLELISRNRKIVGFDLCEVGPGEWDANVGARLLYKLALLADKSRKQL